MPTTPTPAQSITPHVNGACSRGPATPEGNARAAQNATRRGLCGTAEPDSAARIRWLAERIEARIEQPVGRLGLVEAPAVGEQAVDRDAAVGDEAGAVGLADGRE